MPAHVEVYDTTLRDGTQGEQVNFSAEDKVRVARRLDDMGFHYIEGGWPGSNPRDRRFFEMAGRFPFSHARIVAFGSTRRPGIHPERDENIEALLDCGASVITVFGKSWDFHVNQILGISLEENCAMISDTLSFLADRGRRVFYDAEHFFDGFKRNPEYALRTLQSARRGGAEVLVLCDTNGGSLPHEITEIVRRVYREFRVPLGIHAHNDCGLAVANTLAAVMEGASMVQGTVNGYGERCGNADLIAVIANLQLKMGYECVSAEGLARLTDLSHYVSDLGNQPPNTQRPFAGKSAFAHKGGIHVSAVMKDPSAYEHIDPARVGNRRRVLISDLSGKSNVVYKAGELGLSLDGNGMDGRKIVQEIKRLEDEGYQFEAAEGSFELLVKKATGRFVEPFCLEHFRVTIEKNGDREATSHATVKISVGGEQEITAAEGDGPVNALDNALRRALHTFFPQIREMNLVDYKVRVIEGTEGTSARVKVLIESRDSKDMWSTIGVSTNIIDASWRALVDSLQYKLSKEPGTDFEESSMNRPVQEHGEVTAVEPDRVLSVPRQAL